MKYSILFLLVSISCFGQVPDCLEYKSYGEQAERLRLSNPSVALLKYQSMIECNPQQARLDSIPEKIITLFQALQKSQRSAGENARLAKIKEKEMEASEKKSNHALAIAYLARVKKYSRDEDYDTAYKYSQIVYSLEKKLLPTDLEPDALKSRISKKIGKPFGNGIFEPYLFYDVATEIFTYNNERSKSWQNVIAEPYMIDFEKNDSTAFLILWQAKSATRHEKEIVVIKLRKKSPESNPVEVARFSVSGLGFKHGDKYHYRDIQVFEEGFIKLESHPNDGGDATFWLFSLVSHKSLFFENTDYEIKGHVDQLSSGYYQINEDIDISQISKEGTIEVEFEKNGQKLSEIYLLPSLELSNSQKTDNETVVAPTEPEPRLQPNTEPKKELKWKKTTLYDLTNLEILKQVKLKDSGYADSSFVYLSKKNTLKKPIVLLAAKGVFDSRNIFLDTIRGQVLIFNRNNRSLIYDYNLDSVLFVMEQESFYNFWFVPTKSPLSFEHGYWLNDSLLNQRDEAGGFLFMNSRAKVIKFWSRDNNEMPSVFENLEYMGFLSDFIRDYRYIKYKTNEKGVSKAMLVSLDGHINKTWNDAKELTEIHNQGPWYIEYNDALSSCGTSVDIISFDRAERQLSVCTIKNIGADLLQLKDGYLIKWPSSSDLTPKISIYAPFKEGLNITTFMDQGLAPDSFVLLGQVLSAGKISSVSIETGILTVKYHLETDSTSIENDNIYFDADLYDIHSLKPLSRIKKAVGIEPWEHLGNRFVKILRDGNLVEILDLRTGSVLKDKNWSDAYDFSILFLDTAKTFLSIRYPYESGWYLDVFSYPKLRKCATFRLGLGTIVRDEYGNFRYTTGAKQTIQEKYFAVFTDYIDSTEQQQFHFFKIKQGSLKKLFQKNVTSEFRVASGDFSYFSADLKEVYDPESYTSYFTKNLALKNGIYVSTAHMFQIETFTNDSSNVKLFSLEPFKEIKSWNNVQYIDSTDDQTLIIHFKAPKCDEHYSLKNHTVLMPCSVAEKIDPGVDILYEDKKYQLLSKSETTYSVDAYSDETQINYKFRSKRSNKEITWNQEAQWHFDASNERLFIFPKAALTLNYLIVVECRSNFKADTIFGAHNNYYDLPYYAPNSYSLWHHSGVNNLRIGAIPLGKMVLIEQDKADKSKFVLHVIDTLNNNAYDRTISFDTQYELYMNGEDLIKFAKPTSKNGNYTITLFNLKTWRNVPNIKWLSPAIYKINPAYKIGIINNNFYGFIEAGSPANFILFDPKSRKITNRFPISTENLDKPIVFERLDAYHIVRHNLIGQIDDYGYDSDLASGYYDLEIFGDSLFENHLLHLEKVEEYHSEGNLFFVAIKSLYEGNKPTWEVYNMAQGFKKINSYENAAFQIDPLSIYQNERPDLPENDHVKIYDITFFKSEAPQLTTTVNGAVLERSYSIFDQEFLFLWRHRTDNTSELRLLNRESLELLPGNWADVPMRERPFIEQIGEIVFIKYNYQGKLFDLGLYNRSDFKLIKSFQGISDWAWLPDLNSFGLTRQIDTLTHPGLWRAEILSLSDFKQITGRELVRNFPFSIRENIGGFKLIPNEYDLKDEEEYFAFLDEKLYRLPNNAVSVEVEGEPKVFFGCDGKIYSASAAEDQTNYEDWVIKIFEHALGDADKEPFKIITAKKDKDYSSYEPPNIQYSEKKCALIVRFGDNIPRFFSLKQ